MQQWDITMGSNVEAFFPMKRHNGMTEEQTKVKNGYEKGVRRKVTEDLKDLQPEVKVLKSVDDRFASK